MDESAHRPRAFSRAEAPAVLVVCLVVGMALPVGAASGADSYVDCADHGDPLLSDHPWLIPFEVEISPSPSTQQELYYEFMWESFIALNWPAREGERGVPDCSESLRGDDPERDRVWETYPGPLEIFLPECRFDTYPTWDALCHPGPDGECAREFRHRKIPADFAILVNQPGLSNLSLSGEDDFPSGALVDQDRNYVRYQVGINRSYFEYLRRNEYFDRAKQTAAVEEFLADPASPGAFQPLPKGLELYVQELPIPARHGMIEVKAAWRQIGELPPEIKRRYISRFVELDVLDTGQKKPVTGRRLMGLVALHILRYTPTGIVAATFEQVDNVRVGHHAPEGLTPSFNNGDPPSPIQSLIGFENRRRDNTSGNVSAVPVYHPPERPQKDQIVAVYRASPIPEGVRAVNAKYQAALYGTRDEPSPLAFYELIGTQNRHPGDDYTNRETNGHEGPKTGVYTNSNNLINTALESYTQRNISCIMCHVAARPIGVTQASFGIDHFKILSFLMRRACPNESAAYCHCE